MSKLDSLELKESYIDLKMLGYDENGGKSKCSIDGTIFLIDKDGCYSDDSGNEYKIDERKDVMKKYRESQINNIIVGYNTTTGYYECSIGGNMVYVDRNGDYYSGGDNLHVNNWNNILAQYRGDGIEIGTVKVTKTKVANKVIKGTRDAIAGINATQIVDKNDKGDQNTEDTDDEDDREWKKERQRRGYFNE